MIACFAMTVFTCFVLQDADIEGNFSVLSNQDCQFVNLLLSEKLAMILLHQRFVQAQSTDKICNGLVGNETVECYSIILEKRVAIILQTNRI